MSLSAPFPWFGGKSRAAHLIWPRFGDVPNYVEPFAGSLAVLLARPHPAKTETINDLDCYVANFWRAVQHDPAGVATFADWPVNEADLLARHEWLINLAGFRQQMRSDAYYYSPKIAGWWVWGLCCWIGSGWCRERGDGHPPEQLPHLGDAGRGIHRSKLPHLGDAGRGDALRAWIQALSERLARIRVACGNWDRVLGPSVTEKHGLTAVLLDPPYSASEHDLDYSASSGDVAAEVRAWALLNGANASLRIALCGYDGEHDMPGWTSVEWKNRGGYGSQADGRGRDNAERERIWFSPHCLDVFHPKQSPLFREASA
jgi:DNA adenine methylase